MSATLFIISTPIGNLEDISERTKRIISEADFLLVERRIVRRSPLYSFGSGADARSGAGCSSMDERLFTNSVGAPLGYVVTHPVDGRHCSGAA